MGQRFPLAREAILELCRFLGLVLLAFRNLRADLEGVSASDALTSNGGLVARFGFLWIAYLVKHNQRGRA